MSWMVRQQVTPARLADMWRAVRKQTLATVATTPSIYLSRQWHPNLSPVQWHLGHVGVVEDFWIRQQCWQQSDRHPDYALLFDPTRTPKWNRQALPPLADLLAYLDEVRSPILTWLYGLDEFPDDGSLLERGWIVAMVLQHECQHQEIMQMVRYLMPASGEPVEVKHPCSSEIAKGKPSSDFIEIPAGGCWQGCEDPIWSLDNERDRHWVDVAAFAIARRPVSNLEYLRWMESGGYAQQSSWSEAGWAWKVKHAIAHPLHWRLYKGMWQHRSLRGWIPLQLDRPVMGVSWYEANAYARSRGLRLPTETEWERAATWRNEWKRKLHWQNKYVEELTAGEPRGGLENTGCVWEWTATPFHPYPGFRAFPYREYSEAWFDGNHYTLRGGSWATHSLLRRPSFRNWYEPHVREIFAGIRCASDT